MLVIANSNILIFILIRFSELKYLNIKALIKISFNFLNAVFATSFQINDSVLTFLTLFFNRFVKKLII